jgi:hypothetical protein
MRSHPRVRQLEKDNCFLTEEESKQILDFVQANLLSEEKLPK